MTRDMTAATQAAAEARTQAPRYFVELQLDSGTVRLWDGIGSITALGETWTGAGRLGRVLPGKETKEVVAVGLTLELMVIPTPEMPDAPDAFLNIALAEDYQGRPAIVYEGYVDEATGLIIADPYPIFGGTADVFEDSEIPGAAIVKLTCENVLRALERPKKRTYTPEDQKAIYSGDTFFDYVAPLQNRQIVLKR